MTEPETRIVTVDGRKRRPWSLSSKAKLIEAAVSEIAEVGYSKARIASIAKRAGMAPGSVYTWFEDKEDLFVAALEHSLESQIARNLEALQTSADTRDNLNDETYWLSSVAMLVPRNYQDSGPTDVQMLHIEAYYAAWRDPSARTKLEKHIDSLIAMYRNIVQRAQDAGHVTTAISAEELGLLLMGVPLGLSFLNLAGAPRIADTTWLHIYAALYEIVKP
jgi:AcrR family transcriptional regulator